MLYKKRIADAVPKSSEALLGLRPFGSHYIAHLSAGVADNWPIMSDNRRFLFLPPFAAEKAAKRVCPVVSVVTNTALFS